MLKCGKCTHIPDTCPLCNLPLTNDRQIKCNKCGFSPRWCSHCLSPFVHVQEETKTTTDTDNTYYEAWKWDTKKRGELCWKNMNAPERVQHAILTITFYGVIAAILLLLLLVLPPFLNRCDRYRYS